MAAQAHDRSIRRGLAGFEQVEDDPLSPPATHVIDQVQDVGKSVAHHTPLPCIGLERAPAVIYQRSTPIRTGVE